MDHVKIAVRQTDGYDDIPVREAVGQMLDALEAGKGLTHESRVLIKPNLVTTKGPDTGVTTHPSVIAGVIYWLKKQGVSRITVADSPGGPYIPARLRSIYAACGYQELAAEAELNYDTGWKTRSNAAGSGICPQFNLIQPVVDADYIINVPKLKTHSMTVLSGGIKNLFGCVPGLQKPEMHYRYQDQAAFARMLVELAYTVAPNVTVMDATEAMEGNGPTGGSVRKTGVLMASKDVFTLDFAAAAWIGLSPAEVPMLHISQEMGFIQDFTIDGELPVIEPFQLPEAAQIDFMTKIPKGIRRSVKKIIDGILRPVPKIDEQICVGCGKCAESCPPHTIEIVHGKASIHLRKCISCFCCQEMCPIQAIRIKRLLRF